MTLLIGPLSYHDNGNMVVLCNGRGEVLTEISPQQILGQVPTTADKITIAKALVERFNAAG